MAWYALYTKPRHEKKVYEQLLEKNIETFLPMVKTLRQWKDRRKWVEMGNGKIAVNGLKCLYLIATYLSTSI
jgi:hypothetical protein